MTHVPHHLAARAVGIDNGRMARLVLAGEILAKIKEGPKTKRYLVEVKSLLAWARPDKRERIKERLGVK